MLVKDWIEDCILGIGLANKLETQVAASKYPYVCSFGKMAA